MKKLLGLIVLTGVMSCVSASWGDSSSVRECSNMLADARIAIPALDVSNGMFVAPADIDETIPADFSRFYFSGYDRNAQLLNRYLWYHFSHRLGNAKTLFNKEYLTVADLWLGGALDKSRQKSIQEVHREDILAMTLDDEGYVHTHQHYSHAHEHGWPFPMWTQASNNPKKVAGKTAGWHFEDNGQGWALDALRQWKLPQYIGLTATQGWTLENVKSLGISDNKWQLETTGESPAIITPEGMEIDSFQAPFLQLRWTRTGEPKNHLMPYVEWLREGDTAFGIDRRVYFNPRPGEEQEAASGTSHSMIEMYRHPRWIGKIKRIRICLAPGESDVKFAIDSFFTVYDTRHSINNPIFIFASWNYFRWTGDIDFLRRNINRMRMAQRYQMTEMGGLKYNHIRNTWIGHDGLAGYVVNPNGSKTMRGGHGIGNNYWDIMPFGWDDAYSTNQYYGSTIAMAEAEEAIRKNPGWGISWKGMAFDPAELRKHAAAVKSVANKLFWDEKKGRFIACIDKEGKPHDYGYTFLNLDAIWYGIATDEHAKRIMDWISGKRIVKGDTSTGADIYHWRFGPRATTLRNVDWYGQVWIGPETIPWGGQVQDGGAVMGFEFHDLMARIRVYGPDDAWRRLCELLKWEDEVLTGGGYREYYKNGKHGTTLQGGGTAGGIGIDFEFFESSMVPAAVTLGFIGLDPTGNALRIDPKLPRACPVMGVSNILYHNVRLDVKAGERSISVRVNDKPTHPIKLVLNGKWTLVSTGQKGSTFELAKPGISRFERFDSRGTLKQTTRRQQCISTIQRNVPE